MTKSEQMRIILEAAFSPLQLNIIDESAKHANHAGAKPGGETHYRIEMLSEKFAGLPRISRHRLINETLKDFFRDGLHALEIHATSPHE